MSMELKEEMQKTEKNTQNTFIVVLSVFKFVLGNIQKEIMFNYALLAGSTQQEH